MEEKKLYLDIDNLLEHFSTKHSHILSTTEDKKEEFLDWFARKWRDMAEEALYEEEE